jgi:hypothetical protein
MFLNAFPDVKTRGEWLSSALKTELGRRLAESQVIRNVNARAVGLLEARPSTLSNLSP